MTTGFSGIGAGVDFTGLIDAAVEAEKATISGLQTRKTDANRKASVLGDLITKLKALDLKVKALDTPAELFGTSSESSTTPTVKQALSGDESKLVASATSSASVGSYTIRALNLSAAQVNRSRTFSSSDGEIGSSGSFGITVGDSERVDISFDFSESLEDVAASINASDARVHAAVAYDGSSYQLVVTGEPGEENAISFDTLAGPDMEFGLNEVQAAQDARFLVDGVEYRSSSNTATEAIEGVTFHLLEASGSDVNLTVAETAAASTEEDGASTSTETALSRVDEVVSAYNDVIKALQTQLTDDSTGNRGKLFGDLTLQSLQRGLGGVIGSGYGHEGGNVSMGTFGITINRDGSLTLDSTKFSNAVDSDSAGLEAFIYGDNGEGGITGGLSELIDRFTQSTTGILSSRQSLLKDEANRFDEQIERVEDRATQLGDRLRKQFAALDRLMVNLNSQTTYIAALFNA
ncbi:MAG: flagellar filament capping protein FliD [Deltaproteobacteria bacterium]|nr:flagellar filament capping protein FliD [Deltaproteobacteria bacterium]